MASSIISVIKTLFTSEPRPSLKDKLELLEQQVNDDHITEIERFMRKVQHRR